MIIIQNCFSLLKDLFMCVTQLWDQIVNQNDYRQSVTCVYVHSHSLSFTHSPTLSPFLSLPFPHPFSHSLSLFLPLTPSLSLSHTHFLPSFLSLTPSPPLSVSLSHNFTKVRDTVTSQCTCITCVFHIMLF